MSEAEIKAALDGYKNGKGGALKELMIQEVNLGVDTDAMAGDIYNECRTPGFDEPSDEFIFQKRFAVKTLHKLKQNIKKTKSKEDKPKIVAQIKAIAFSMLTYDDLLKEKIDLKTIPAHTTKMDMPAILQTVTAVKKCVDHSFTDEEIVKCRTQFVTLAVGLIRDKEKKIKAKQKTVKPPLYTGEGSVDISQYLK